MSLEEMQEQVERYYIEMENELLMNIAKKLSMGKPMEIDKFDTEKGVPIVGSGGVNEWQLERLKELGGLNDENARIIAKYSGKTIDEVNKILERAREIGTEVDKEILDLGIKAGILNEINPITEEFQVKKVLDASVREVLTTFNQQNSSLLASAGTNYREIVNKVSSQVLAGAKTVNKAMEEAVSELAQNGLTGFTAKNGAQWSPEAYTKMVLRTNTQNTINRVQEERMRLAGNDYVEISSHIGARPLCSEDQGKIFSLSDNTEPIVDGAGHHIKVYAWSNSSYGEPAGILGINCGHSRYMFVPGLSIHREKTFTKAENDEAYQEKQQQRLYERTIRNKKREIAMLETTGADDLFIKQRQTQLKNYNKQYAEFLNRTGRTRISSNEWIGTSDLSKPQIKKVNRTLSKWKTEVKEKEQITEQFVTKDKQKYKILSNKEYIELSRKQNVSEKEMKIIINGTKGYVGTNNSFYINKVLREIKKEKLHYSKTLMLDDTQKKVISTLTSVINRNKLEENLFATRELSEAYLFNIFGDELINLSDNDIIKVLNSKWVGKTIPADGGFFSCALNSNKVLRRKVLLNVHIPNGTKGFVANNPMESEIILGRTTKYSVIGASLQKNDDMDKIVIDILIK